MKKITIKVSVFIIITFLFIGIYIYSNIQILTLLCRNLIIKGWISVKFSFTF